MDVLIVGAGPVGLTLAAELARHGVRARLIDKASAPSRYCRAIGVTPRTLEVWDDMGIVRTIIDAGLWIVGQRTVVDGQTHDTIFDFATCPMRISASRSTKPSDCSRGISSRSVWRSNGA